MRQRMRESFTASLCLVIVKRGQKRIELGKDPKLLLRGDSHTLILLGHYSTLSNSIDGTIPVMGINLTIALLRNYYAD